MMCFDQIKKMKENERKKKKKKEKKRKKKKKKVVSDYHKSIFKHQHT